MDENVQLLSVEKLLKGKFGPKVPKLVIALFRRLLHEDYVNELIASGKRGVDFTTHVRESLQITLQVEGLENVPREGRFTVASNHPLGGHDALAIVDIFGRHFNGKVRIMVNDFLMYLSPLSDLFVPVNKVGGAQARSLAALTDEMFASDNQVLIFPAGKCARRIKGKIQELPWGKAFVSKSVKYGRDIVPMHFTGRNSWRFYALDAIGNLLGIKKFPLAMILLVDEMYRARGKTFRIAIGKPIPYQTFDASKTPAEWAAWVREQTLSL